MLRNQQSIPCQPCTGGKVPVQSGQDRRCLEEAWAGKCSLLLASDPRPRDDRDAAQDLARDLADIAAPQIFSIKGEAKNWLSDPSYGTLRLRLELANAAVDGAMVPARRVRLSEGDGHR